MEFTNTSNADDTTDQLLWVNKYRPHNLQNVVLQPQNRKSIETLLATNAPYLPNLLFHGPPGTGKTSAAINFIHSHPQYSGIHMMINGSDDRTVDVVRQKIAPFANTTKSMFQQRNAYTGNLRFIIIDEVDYMEATAQEVLKLIIQSSPPTTIFCLLCNYIGCIHKSIVQLSRTFAFATLPQKSVIQSLRQICKQEHICITTAHLNQIYTTFNNDMRGMINYIQHCYAHGIHKHCKTIKWTQVSKQWKKSPDKIFFVIQHAHKNETSIDEWITEYFYHAFSSNIIQNSKQIQSIQDLLRSYHRYNTHMFILYAYTYAFT